MKASSLVDGKIVIDKNICNNCGRCVEKCPFKVITSYGEGYRIYIGGRWGKKTARGIPLNKVFTDKEELLSAVEKAIILFRDKGIAGERFGDTIQRLGFENVEKEILSL